MVQGLIRLSFGLLLMLAAPPASPVLAQEPKGGPVYVDPESADEDFPFQGEFRGWMAGSHPRRATRTAGLHVVALGGGEFGAAIYAGGLPGEGWFGGARELLTGQRVGEELTLAGGPWRLSVTPDTARLTGSDDALLGEFQKVHRVSPTIGARPPVGATVLFDGRATPHFLDPKVTPEGWLLPGTETTTAYGDFRLHAEFRLPYKPYARGQERGNSGFYLQSRYEVQVLDSFGLEGVENECAALYRTRRPEFNMCYPPLTWQTYDVDFTTPRFDPQGQKVAEMRISVWHNGVLVHRDAMIPHKTGAGQPEGPQPLPTKLQDHGNPVVFRNLWLVEKPESVMPAVVVLQ